MIHVLNNIVLECRIENWLVVLISRVEFLEELDRDRWVTVFEFHNEISHIKHQNRQLESSNSELIEEVNKLSKKKRTIL